jgi:hypothetical protein
VKNRVKLTVAAMSAFLLIAAGCSQQALAPYKAYASDADVPRISVEDAKKDYDAGTAVIIDSRDANSYEQEHVKGAINVPNGSGESEFAKIPQGKKIIVYCS